MINDEVDEVIKELFHSLVKKYRIGLEKPMRDNDFIFDCVYLLYYKCHKINPNCVASYMDSPDWTKNKKSRINPINKKDKCFQYTITVALNH